MTVADLRARLSWFADNLPVVFCTPRSGGFGPETHYTISIAELVQLPEGRETVPATKYIDDETGEEVEEPAYEVHRPAWHGIVLR
jgi:hypothetical protein